ncbi:MAG: restriction endonuclease subunit S [Azoarcus sp.]|jgi:type I restriction enzyme S subunit|nr:restriction endonuclease subunit S [Azoarcus sp.]
MAGEWRETTLGDVIELKRGYDLPQKERKPGNVPLVSSSGVSDRHAVAMVKGPGVVTGRYGTIGKVFFIKDDFWPLNTTLYVKDFKGNAPQFVSYFLRSINFHAYTDKAAVPGVNRNDLHLAEVVFPNDVEEQRAIVRILGALDDKIELNRRINETLEAMARALFKSWFVDFDGVAGCARHGFLDACLRKIIACKESQTRRDSGLRLRWHQRIPRYGIGQGRSHHRWA